MCSTSQLEAIGKMALLAASMVSSVTLRQQQSQIIHTYAPELDFALRYSNAIGSALFLVIQQAFLLSHVALTYLYRGSKFTSIQSLLISKFLLAKSAVTLCQTTWIVWDSKTIRRLRKKLEFEFFVLILGFGNGLVLSVFWPGWIFLATIAYFFWAWAG